MKLLWQSIKYGFESLCTRRIYLLGMIIVPILCCMFFLSLLNNGLPTRVPTAIVDLDHSPLSRQMTRNLNAQQLIHITESCESYDRALDAVRQGRVFGFYVIPADFQADALSGRKPTIDYYSNMTYFVPGTFSYKGMRTIAVQTTAALVGASAQAKGLPANTVSALIQPMSIDINPVHNPWTNYSLYLSPSFVAALFELMIVLITIMSITYELKQNTSRRWLDRAGGSIIVAVTGKLLPQTIIFTIVGWCLQGMLFGMAGFPMLCSPWVMAAAMPLFVLASQAFGLFWACIMPSPRFAMSFGALFSILAFSFTGFSFPVQNMYGAIAIFSWMMPVRYYFLIHIEQALNGVPLYYSRLWFVLLIALSFVPALTLWRLKRACRRQIYVP